MMLLYIVRVCLPFQLVLVSGTHNIFISCLVLLSIILRNMSPFFTNLNPFGFYNNSLVKPLSFLNSVTKRCIVIYEYEFCEGRFFHVFWGIGGTFVLLLDYLKPNV